MRRVSLTSRYLWIFLGSLVDHKKKTVMMLSALCSLFISIRLHHFISAPTAVFTDPSSVILWFIILVLVAIVGHPDRLANTVTLNPEGRAKKWFWEQH